MPDSLIVSATGAPAAPAEPAEPNGAWAGEPPLLGPDEPAPYEAFNPDGAAPLLLVCDHATRFLPRRLGTLGLSEAELTRHIAWDIGIAEVTRGLARRLDAPALLSRFSRLAVDPNRALDDPTLIPQISVGSSSGLRSFTWATRSSS